MRFGFASLSLDPLAALLVIAFWVFCAPVFGASLATTEVHFLAAAKDVFSTTGTDANFTVFEHGLFV